MKEVGSGVNDGRKKPLALLADPTVTVIVIEHKDRLTRFGFCYIDKAAFKSKNLYNAALYRNKFQI